MGAAQTQRYCHHCEEYTLHQHPSFGFGWGCLLTVLTGGLFIPIWFFIKMIEALAETWRCQRCGSTGSSKRGPAAEGEGGGPLMNVLPAMAGAFGVLLFVVMVPVLLYFRPRAEPTPTEQASADKAQVGKEASGGKFHVGDQVQIARPGGAGNFHVARTEADLDRLHEAIDRKELATFREMREAGDIDVVPNGMKATVLESKEGRVKVRLTRPASGDEAVGWIDDQYAQPIMAEPDQPAPVIAAPAQAIDPSAPAPAPKPVAADPSKRKPRYAGEVLPGESLYDKMQQEHPDPPKKPDSPRSPDLPRVMGPPKPPPVDLKEEVEANMHNALAAGILESAQKFELAGNTKGAMILYRDIVKSYAGTDAAAKAAKRIEALDGKR